MKMYIKQRIFSWRDRFNVSDENGNELFYIEGEIFTWGKKLHIYSNNGEELAFIRQKVWSFLPRYFISQNGEDVAEVVKEFTLFRQEYSVSPIGWSVEGDFFAHDYNIIQGNEIIADISKRWFTWSDTFEISVPDDRNNLLSLCIVLIIDAVLDDQAASQNN